MTGSQGTLSRPIFESSPGPDRRRKPQDLGVAAGLRPILPPFPSISHPLNPPGNPPEPLARFLQKHPLPLLN
jgi:hypothetical protein